VEEGSFLQEGDAGGAPVAPKKEKLGDVRIEATAEEKNALFSGA
jgi:hypothetical protein